MQNAPVFCWLVASSTARVRYGRAASAENPQSTMPRLTVCTRAVQKALEDLSAEAPLLKAILPVAFATEALPQEPEKRAAAWADMLGPLTANVVGACLLSPMFIEAVESVLSDSSEQVRDFWSLTRYWHEPFLHFKVMEPCMFQAVVGHNHARIGTRSVGIESKWFYHMHDAGLSRHQGLLPHKLQQQATSLCFKLPAPHALLLASGRWAEYCLPVVRSGRSRSFSAGAALLQALPLPPQPACWATGGECSCSATR